MTRKVSTFFHHDSKGFLIDRTRILVAAYLNISYHWHGSADHDS